MSELPRRPATGPVDVAERGGPAFCNNPWFALKGPRGYTFGALGYSGNWTVTFSRDVSGETTVTGGIADQSLPKVLTPGQIISSAEVVLGSTPGDANAVSGALHAYQRSSLLLKPARQPPVVFDHFFAVNPSQPTEERLHQLAGDAARPGCEVFLLDAGWYANQNVSVDTTWFEQAGLDRQPACSPKARPPDRLRALIGYGIWDWMEPETAGPRVRLPLRNTLRRRAPPACS